MAKSKPVWDKPRPKGLGKSKKLTPAQKAKAKARAKANNRKYPNMIDNMWAASRQAIRIFLVPNADNISNVKTVSYTVQTLNAKTIIKTNENTSSQNTVWYRRN